MSKRSTRLIITKSNNEIEEINDTSSVVTYKPDKVKSLFDGPINDYMSNAYQAKNNSFYGNGSTNLHGISNFKLGSVSIRPVTALNGAGEIPSLKSIRLPSSLSKGDRDQNQSRNH